MKSSSKKDLVSAKPRTMLILCCASDGNNRVDTGHFTSVGHWKFDVIEAHKLELSVPDY